MLATGEFYMEYGRLKMIKQETEVAVILFENSLTIFQKNYDESHEKVIQVKEYLTQINNVNSRNHRTIS